jgi:hypothetical protein
MIMTSFSTRVMMDAGLLVATLGLVGGWFGGRAILLGILAGGVLAVSDFWWLSARIDAASADAPRPSVWAASAGFRLAGVAVAVAALFLTGWFHPAGLVVGLAVLPCALVARGLSVAREGA